MSAGGGQGNWGPWPVQGLPGSGAVSPGQVKIDASDANPGYLGTKIIAPAGGGIIISPAAGPPETLTIKLISADKMMLPYYWNSTGGPFSSYDGYIFTSSPTLYDVASIAEYPTPLDFVANKVFLAVNVTGNVVLPFGAPPATWELQPTKKGVPIVGTSLNFANGQLGYFTNEATIVGALGDTFGLQLIGTNLAVAPAVQNIEFTAILYILGNGTT
jgi:hypothetical protein